MNLHAFALLVVLALASRTPGQTLEAELNRPYRLEVVLDIGKHRLLTDVFKEQVKRELEDGLQAAYGEMARVRVIDRIEEDTRLSKERQAILRRTLEDVRKRGLQKALDDWKDLSKEGVKTHFVRIDFLDGRYEVQARQQDGLTGQASPVARQDHTSDRAFVSRLVTFLVDRDFGIVGTVPPGATPKSVLVKLKGGDMSRWVQKGDVFLVVPIPAGAQRAVAARDAYLVVDEPPAGNGDCRCKLFDRLGRALKGPKSVEFRCMKIHTIKAPLRIRVVQGGETPSPGSNITVFVRRHAFDGEETSRLQGTTDSDGIFSTDRGEQSVYDRIAFVTLKLEPKPAIVPVPLIDERPVTVGIARQTQDSLLTVKKQLWEQTAYDSGLSQQELFRQLKEMEGKPALRGKALERARQGLNESMEMLKELAKDREDLVKEAGRNPGVKFDTTFGDSWVRFVDAGNARLRDYVQGQERIQKEETDPKRLEMLALVRQAELEMSRAEFGKALELYQKAIASGSADAKLKEHVAKLEAKWKPKNEQHRLARIYIYETFPNLNLFKTKEALEEASNMFAVCDREKDTLTPQKLLQEILAHGGKLKDEEKKLDPDVNEEDRAAVKRLADVAGELRKLGTRVQAYLQQHVEK